MHKRGARVTTAPGAHTDQRAPPPHRRPTLATMSMTFADAAELVKKFSKRPADDDLLVL